MSRPNQPTPEEILRKYWGYDSFRPLQGEIIASVLSGHDTLGLLPHRRRQIADVSGAGNDTTGTDGRGHPADFAHDRPGRQSGAARHTRRVPALRTDTRRAQTRGTRCNAGHAKFLYISPEKLQSDTFLDTLRHIDVSLIVVDEAHCISQWGYDFRPSYLNIARLRTLFPDVPLLALTASATPEVRADIMEPSASKAGGCSPRALPAQHILHSQGGRSQGRTASESAAWNLWLGHSLRQITTTHARDSRHASGRRHIGGTLSRRTGDRREKRETETMEGGAYTCHGGHQRLRHGDRQARRALRTTTICRHRSKNTIRRQAEPDATASRRMLSR